MDSKVNVKQKLSPEESDYLIFLRDYIVKSISLDEEASKDFALLFFYMGGHDQILTFLDKIDNTLENLWFKAELLLKTNRFIDCLAVVSEIEKSWAHIPEVTFSIVYLKALSYWGVNKRNLAIELLNSLVKVKPNYRSAQMHLNNWKNE